MTKIHVLYMLLFFSFCTHAQKIKIKKETIFINKLKVGHVSKVKTDIDSYFQFTDTNGEKICRAKQTSIPSLLFKGDKEYPHHIFYEDKIKDTISIIEKNYWLNAKRTSEYLLKIGLLNPNGFVTDSILSLVKKTPKYPKWIKENLDKEKEIAKHINFKVVRKINDSLVLKEQPQKEARGQLKRLPCIVTKVEIYQKNGEDEILIGYGLHETESISGYQYYYIFNTKDVPLSFFDTFKYKIYYPYKEYGLSNNKLKNIEGRNNIIMEMALDLIKTEKL